jgi:hypothetical protein
MVSQLPGSVTVVGPGADHSRQGDADRVEAAQQRRSNELRAPAASDADRRERTATVREALADLREHEADQREREADQRDHEANEREATADQREHKANDREEQMQALIAELRVLVTGAHQDALEAIERSLALLSSPADAFQRSEEAVKRTAARRRRTEAANTRAAAQDKRQRATPAAGRGVGGQVREIRTRLGDTVAAFAEAEDNAARIFDQLAVSHPESAGAYQHRAQQARDAAGRAREISRQLADPHASATLDTAG